MSNNQVLVVDDNVDIRFFVRTALTPEGFDVIEAADGNQALELFRKREPAVIILDLSIGQPDGFEVCREIRKVSTVPIIMLTASALPSQVELAKLAGVSSATVSRAFSNGTSIKPETRARITDLARSLGVQFEFGAEVRQIVVKDGRAHGGGGQVAWAQVGGKGAAAAVAAGRWRTVDQPDGFERQRGGVQRVQRLHHLQAVGLGHQQPGV